MELSNSEDIPRYGIESSVGYKKSEQSSLPKSYGALIGSLIREPGRFLDIGGGTGELGIYLTKNYPVEATTIDYSPAGIKESGAEGVVAKADKLPIEDGSVMYVHLKDVVVHLNNEEMEGFVSEARRILNNGGKVIISESNYNDIPVLREKPFVPVLVKGKHHYERIRWNEGFSEIIKRLESKYGNDITPDVPYYPKSKKEIVSAMEKGGFILESSSGYRREKGEPDWMAHPILRNVLVFTPIQ